MWRVVLPVDPERAHRRVPVGSSEGPDISRESIAIALVVGWFLLACLSRVTGDWLAGLLCRSLVIGSAWNCRRVLWEGSALTRQAQASYVSGKESLRVVLRHGRGTMVHDGRQRAEAVRVGRLSSPPSVCFVVSSWEAKQAAPAGCVMRDDRVRARAGGCHSSQRIESRGDRLATRRRARLHASRPTATEPSIA